MASITITIRNCLDLIFVSPTLLIYRLLRYGYTYRRIYLGENEWTILDQQDYCRLKHFKWVINGNGTKFYAARFIKIGPGKAKIMRLHREIMNPPEGLLVDHKNGDSLDNRRANLRLATHSQNTCNSRKTSSETSSRFRGVTFKKHIRKWAARIKYLGKEIYLGVFDSEIDAARAYDRAAIKYHGEFARLNFPREDYNVEIQTTKY